MSKGIKLPDGSVVQLREWCDWSRPLVATVNRNTLLSQQLLGEVVPLDIVWQGFKVDTDIPYPQRARLWLDARINTARYSYACTAFDREYTYVAERHKDGAPARLEPKVPAFSVPLLIGTQNLFVVSLRVEGNLHDLPERNHSITVTLLGVQQKAIE